MVTIPSLDIPCEEHAQWLLDRGVSDKAMLEPWALRGARVAFDRDLFAFDDEGEPALILRAEDRGEAVDLVAWDPIGSRIATWQSIAFCIGDLDRALDPSTWFAGGSLLVCHDPLEWLLRDREGIVVVRPDLAHAYLQHARSLTVTDIERGRQLRQMLRPPLTPQQILVEVPHD